MQSSITENDAMELAQKFLAKERLVLASTPFAALQELPTKVGPCSAGFWWDDRTRPLEFPFVREDDAARG